MEVKFCFQRHYKEQNLLTKLTKTMKGMNVQIKTGNTHFHL